MGKPVRYNSVVQLVHVRSNQFVRISKKVDLSTAPQQPTKIRNQAHAPNRADFMRVYSLALSPRSGPETEFMLTPCFKYQENNEVLAQDSFCLSYKDAHLLNKLFFLHFQPPENKQCSLFNFYLTEEEKTPIRFQIYDDSYLSSHTFSHFHERAIWITHIHAPLYLSLKASDKATDQGDNELSRLISEEEEATTQTFSIDFRPYDPNKPMSSDGLWIGYAMPDSTDMIQLKHIEYDFK